MEPYLTKKAVVSQRGKWILTSLSALMAMSCGAVALDNLSQGDRTQLIIESGLMILFAYPVIRMILKAICRSKARHIAGWLSRYPEETISFHKFSRELGEHAVEELLNLLDKGYLTDIQVDREQEIMVLTAVNQMVKRQIYQEIVCPFCGAKNTVIRGRIGRCEYCLSPLVDRQG